MQGKKSKEMKLIDNITHLLGDDLKATLKPKARLKIAASCFSMYAFEALKAELEKLEQLDRTERTGRTCRMYRMLRISRTLRTSSDGLTLTPTGSRPGGRAPSTPRATRGAGG